MSKSTLGELRTIVERPKFNPYLSLAYRLLFIETLVERARFWEVDSSSERLAEGACRDPKDAKFLALALACQAAHLISSDADLLVLHPWQGIPILTPAQFLQSTEERP
jgi:putative PIN family toxin of toxin-antitoxin system